MKSKYIKQALLAWLCSSAYGCALASPYVVTFSTSDFAPASPVQSISASIRYEASSLYAPIDHLTAIDLTINGHTYTLQEIGFETFYSPPNVMPWNTTTVGGLLNGVGGGSHMTTDFALRWHTDTHAWVDFFYASPDVYGIWGPTVWEPHPTTQFNIAAAPVPEPAGWSVLLAGLLFLRGLNVLRKKRGGKVWEKSAPLAIR